MKGNLKNHVRGNAKEMWQEMMKDYLNDDKLLNCLMKPGGIFGNIFEGTSESKNEILGERTFEGTLQS